MNRFLKPVSISIMCLLLLAFISKQAASIESNFAIPSYSIGGGGRSNNAIFDVAGTNSQSLADQAIGSNFSVQSGFWSEPYELAVQNTLTISLDGNGNGTVKSKPAGINCGGFCSSNFDINSMVTLTPIVAPGSVFTGWNGESCSGIGTCILQIDSIKNVTATFTTAESTSKIFLPHISK